MPTFWDTCCLYLHMIPVANLLLCGYVNSNNQWDPFQSQGPYHRPDSTIMSVIIHQTHYEKSDWSRAFNQFTIACELDMINAISAADIAFIMSSSTSTWLLSPLECSPQKQNGWTLCFCFWGWIIWKMYNNFRMISWLNYQNLVSVLSAFGFGR